MTLAGNIVVDTAGTLYAGAAVIAAFFPQIDLFAAGLLLAPIISGFSGLFHYLQTVLAYLVAPVVVIFIAGRFWRGASSSAALITLYGGICSPCCCLHRT